MFTTTAYIVYLGVSLAMTMWVGRTLHRNGRAFLLAMLDGRAALADAVNHLLLVGFYLVNAAFVMLALQSRIKPVDGAESIEYVSTKVGVVLVVLGVMHFGNILAAIAVHQLKRRAREASLVAPRRQALQAAAVSHLRQLRQAAEERKYGEPLTFDRLRDDS